jgi:hypothetical protein
VEVSEKEEDGRSSKELVVKRKICKMTFVLLTEIVGIILLGVTANITTH